MSPPAHDVPRRPDPLFVGDSEMATRCRAVDWTATALGAPHQWPAALRTIVRVCLESPFPVNLWCGPDRTLIYNDAYRRVLGAKHPSALGRPGFDVWGEIRADLVPMFAQIDAGGPPIYAEDARFVMARAAGETGVGEDAWFTFGLSAVREEDGRIVAYFNPATETTARLAAERAIVAANRELAVERARLTAVFEQSPAFVAVLRGADNVFEFVNDAYESLVGRGRDLVGRSLFDALPETVEQGFDTYLAQVRETGEPLLFRELPALIDRRAGAPREERFLDITYYPLVDADGRCDAVVAHGVDVTESVHARRALESLNYQLEENAIELELQTEELQATTARLAERTEAAEVAERRTTAILSAAGEGILGVAADGTSTFVNPAAAALLGFSEAELIGRMQHDIIHHHHADGTDYPLDECPIFRALYVGAPCRVDTEVFWRKDGTALPVEYTATPVVENGRIVGAVVSFQDVTARRAADADRARLLDEARAARAVAEAERATAEVERARADEANVAKSQFLANMSHELRTPLNAIGGYVQLLEFGIHGSVNDAQRQALDRIQSAQRRLLSLINDVLNYAKIESGHIEYDLRTIDVRDVVADVTPLLEPMLSAKGLALDVHLPDTRCEVRADREKLGQVLVNLLSNATKFTDAVDHTTGQAGRVAVELKTRPAAGEDLVFLRVTDTGRGIPRDKQASIFEPFVQVQAGYARTSEGGTGLGLTISRDLARGMGGDLRVRSQEGHGSTFTVTLRRATTTADGPAADGTRHDGPDERPDEGGSNRGVVG